MLTGCNCCCDSLEELNMRLGSDGCGGVPDGEEEEEEDEDFDF